MTQNVTPMDATDEGKDLDPNITCEALWAMESRGERPTILDVRQESAFEEGHIEWATHLPLGKIEEEAEQILPNKDELIIACCSLGGKSPQAVKKLQAMGYTNVHNLSGGYTGYCARDEENTEEEETE